MLDPPLPDGSAPGCDWLSTSQPHCQPAGILYTMHRCQADSLSVTRWVSLVHPGTVDLWTEHRPRSETSLKHLKTCYAPPQSIREARRRPIAKTEWNTTKWCCRKALLKIGDRAMPRSEEPSRPAILWARSADDLLALPTHHTRPSGWKHGSNIWSSWRRCS